MTCFVVMQPYPTCEPQYVSDIREDGSAVFVTDERLARRFMDLGEAMAARDRARLRNWSIAEAS